MYSSAKYQMDFLEKLAFNRYGGTEDERKAAELILEEVKRLGGSSQIEEFTIPGYSVSKAALEVIEPFHRTLEVNAVGRTPAGCWKRTFSMPKEAKRRTSKERKGKSYF